MTNQKNLHRIVIIEDNPADTMLLRLALEEQQESFLLEVLVDGESALRYISEHCHHPEPCLIILDLHLPRYDGVTVLRAIRSQPELAQVRVVVLTTIASPAEKEQVFALGIQACRVKPTDWGQMVELARELIAICNTPGAVLAAVQSA